MSIRPRSALLGAAGCLILLALVWLAAFHIAFFRHADQSVYLQFGDLNRHGRIDSIAWHFVGLFYLKWYVCLVLVPLAVAWRRGRPRVVLAVAAIVLGANGTAELLKHLLASPRPASFLVGGASPLLPSAWPSGHATAAMSLVLACVLAAPARLRPAVAALGASLSIAVGYSVLTTGVHYPSDVLGGFLVAAIWALGAVAALVAAERWRPSGQTSSGRVSIRAALAAPTAVLLAALGLGALAVAVRTHDVFSYLRGHEAFVVGAAGIAALSLVLSTGVVLSARR